MRIGIQFCYKTNSVDGEHHMELFNLFGNFLPDKISINYNVSNWNYERSKQKILNCGKMDNIIISKPLEIFISTEITGKNRYRNIKITSIVSDSELEGIIETYTSHIDRLFLTNLNLITCFLYNEDFVAQQSAYNESMYMVSKIPLSFADGLPFTKNNWGEKEFDITDNIGRTRKWNGRHFTPSWRMWFNLSEILSYRDRILDFSYFNKVIFENRVLRADLYTNINCASESDEMSIQEKFNKWIEVTD